MIRVIDRKLKAYYPYLAHCPFCRLQIKQVSLNCRVNNSKPDAMYYVCCNACLATGPGYSVDCRYASGLEEKNEQVQNMAAQKWRILSDTICNIAGYTKKPCATYTKLSYYNGPAFGDSKGSQRWTKPSTLPHVTRELLNQIQCPWCRYSDHEINIFFSRFIPDQENITVRRLYVRCSGCQCRGPLLIQQLAQAEPIEYWGSIEPYVNECLTQFSQIETLIITDNNAKQAQRDNALADQLITNQPMRGKRTWFDN